MRRTSEARARNTPAAALTGLEDVLHTSLAVRSASQAALVYSRDLDGDLTNQSDNKLFYSLYNGSTWSVPTAITSDVVTDTLPALAYDASGNLHMLWLRGGDLVWLKNSWDASAAQVIREASTEGGFLDFRLSKAANGNLSVVWQTAADGNNDLAYRIYDATADSWGADHTLMGDAEVEAAHSPAFGTDGNMYLAYQRTATQLVTQTFTISHTLSYTVTNLPTAGQSDLMFLAHTVGRDLTFDSLTLSPPNPGPGQPVTMTAVLRNAGDLTVASPQVDFLDGSVAITDTLTLSPLPGGYTTTVEVQWTLPVTQEVHTLAAVADPNGAVTETDEGNNTIELVSVLPDLQIEAAYTSPGGTGITVTVQIANQGVIDVISGFGLDFRAGNPLTGTLVASLPIDHVVAAGQAITVTRVLTDLTALTQSGGVLWAVVDEADAILEADETNNAGPTGFQALPDLTLRAADITAQGSTVEVSIHNQGIVTGTDVLVEVRQGASLIFIDTIASIAPGGAAQLMISPGLGTSTLYIKIDPDNTISETDEGNNLASREVDISTKIYLPLIFR